MQYLMPRFDKERFAQNFAAFLAENALKGTDFAELSEIPQYQVSRILCGKLQTFGIDHQKICKYMHIAESRFFLGNEEDFVQAIERFCAVDPPRARRLARIVADIASLPEPEQIAFERKKGHPQPVVSSRGDPSRKAGA